MVYTGKPSKGCHSCRKRKIQCDQLPDGCSQCSRSQRQCPGYPKLSNFTFRDQTQIVIRKSQTKSSDAYLQSFTTTTPSEPKTLSSIGSAAVSNQHESSLTALPSPRSWLPTGDECATEFFVSNFVLGTDVTSEGHSEGHLERIAQINYEAEEHLLASMKAAGFAGLFGTLRDPALLVNARRHYVTAVKRTNAALRSPNQVKRDGTLLAVLVLGLFERVVGDDTQSLVNYEYHVKGAAAILKIRGREQLSSPEGRRMFIQATSALLSLCMLQDMHIPVPILELREDPIIRADVTKHESMQILDITITCVEFSASVKDGNISDPNFILARALELDKLLVTISDNAPLSWRYSTVYDANADPRAVFAGCYHEYASVWIARMWTIIRTVRLSLHTNIRDTLMKSSSHNFPGSINPEYSAQLLKSRDVMCKIQADLLASVPAYIGRHHSPYWPSNYHGFASRQQSIGEEAFEDKPVHFGTSADNTGPQESLATTAQYIIFPLYKAAMVAVDDAMRAGQLWSLQMLKYVGQIVGIRQALWFAAIIEQNIQQSSGVFETGQSDC